MQPSAPPPIDYRSRDVRVLSPVRAGRRNLVVGFAATAPALLINPWFWAWLGRHGIGDFWPSRLDLSLLAILLIGAHASAFVGLFRFRVPGRDEASGRFEVEQTPILLAAIALILSFVTSGLAWFFIGMWRGFNPG